MSEGVGANLVEGLVTGRGFVIGEGSLCEAVLKPLQVQSRAELILAGSRSPFAGHTGRALKQTVAVSRSTRVPVDFLSHELEVSATARAGGLGG